jgi:hypothetical protein
MPPADRTAWERLGRMLAERRTQISPRYANRRAFAADREMNWRTLHDIEHAKRTNFKPETMRAFEAAYLLVPGSLDRALDGGGLEPLPAAPVPLRPAPEAPSVTHGSPAEEILANLLARYPDDKIITDVLGSQVREGKPARVIVNEILGWLDFLESKAEHPQNGTSAG